MRLSLAFALILIYSSLISQDYNCQHHGYKIFDTVYVWKHNGIDLLKTKEKKAKVISKIPYGEKVIVLQLLNAQTINYPENPRYPSYKCYTDTILKSPLIVTSTPMIKIIHNRDTGYVMENYLDYKKPFSIYNNLNWVYGYEFTQQLDITYQDKWFSAGHREEDEFSKVVFNNGVTVVKDRTHGMDKTKTIIPNTSRINYNLIIAKCFSDYQANPEIKFSYELIEGIYHLNWKGIDNGDLGNNHGATYYYNDYGMIIEYWNDAH